MKIVFIARRFYPEVKGGGQISAYYIANGAAKLGHEVHIVSFTDKKPSTQEMDNMTMHWLQMPKLKHFPRLSNMDYMYVQMAKLSSPVIEEVQPDILHLLNFESIPLSSIYFKKKFNIPIIATVNGPNFGCFIQTGRDYKNDKCINCRVFKRALCSVDKWGKIHGSLFYLYSHWYMNMLRLSYKYVDLFACVSNEMKPLMRNMGVPSNKMLRIFNPIGEQLEVDKKLLKKLKKKYKGKILFAAGRMSKTKGFQYAIQALEYLPDDYTLLIAGWGGMQEKLKQLAKENELKDRVVFLGRVKYQQMGTYYALADVLVHFPTFFEPFGRTIIEAMSVGTPVVAYPIGGMKETVIDGHNGKLVKSRNPRKMANAIQQFFDSNNFAAIQKHCRNDDRFGNKKIAQEYIEAYERLVEQT